MKILATPNVLTVLQYLDELNHTKELQKIKEENAHRSLNGDFYDGQYVHDQRNGYGRYTWSDGKTYDGTFFADKMHGIGRLETPELIFVGTFFLDKRSGFGIVRFSNNVLFQGFYADNERCGFGIQIYTEQSPECLLADTGQWRHNRLVKLSVELPGAVNPLTEFSDYMWYADSWKHTRKASLVDDCLLSADDEELYDCKDANRIQTLSARKPVHVWESASIDFERDTAYEAFIRLITSSREWRIFETTWPTGILRKDVTNGLLTDPQLAAFICDLARRHGLPVTDQDNARTHPLGPHSQAALQFLKLCQSGDNPAVRTLVSRSLSSKSELESTRSTQVDVNVADAQGRTALLLAALSLNMDLVKVLLDFGADPNQETIGGLTVLNICIMQYLHQKASAKAKSQMSSRSRNHFIVCPSYAENEASSSSERSLSERSNSEYESTDESEDLECPVLTKKIWYRAELRWQLPSEPVVSQTPASTFSRLATEVDGEKPPRSRLLTATFKTKDKSFTMEPRLTPISRFKDIFHTRDKGNRGISGVLKADTSEDRSEDLTLDLEDETRTILPPLKLAPPFILTKYMSRKQFLEILHKQLVYKPSPKEPQDVPTATIKRLAIVEAEAHGTSESSGPQSGTISSTPRQLTRSSSSAQSPTKSRETPILLARSHLKKLDATLDMVRLLLSRGARPNASDLPIPTLTMAVQVGDVSLTRLLLQYGANANVKLPEVAPEKIGMMLISEDRRRFYPSVGGLAPLHFAVILPGRAGVQITEMLLDALADPNTRAEPDLSFLTESQCKMRRQIEKGVIELDNAMMREEYAVGGGRTPLHLVCSRDYDTVNAVKIVNLLLQRGADPNILCNGYSPLGLAIANGSEQIVDRLLADPRTRVSLPLTNGLGNALCVAAGTQYEFRWPLELRLRLIRKLIDPSPLDLILVPVRCPPDCSEGNVVDHVYCQFTEDKSIFGKAFYSLTPEERAVSVERAAVLELLVEAMREASCQFGGLIQSTDFAGSNEHMLYRYCYECGRSVDVKLVPCTRCKKVFYCSSACKFKSWSTRHKKECQMVKSKSLTKKEKPPKKGNYEAKIPGKPRRQDSIPGIQIWHVQDPDFSEEAASNHPATDYGFRFGFYMRMDRQERVQLHSYPRNGNYSLL